MHENFHHRQPSSVLPSSWTMSLHGCVYHGARTSIPFAKRTGDCQTPAHYFFFAMAPHVAFRSWLLPLARLECTAWLRDFHSSFHRLVCIHALPRSERLAGSLIYMCKFSRHAGCCQCSLTGILIGLARIAKYKNVSLSQIGAGRQHLAH
jgi:hypothetical protein